MNIAYILVEVERYYESCDVNYNNIAIYLS